MNYAVVIENLTVRIRGRVVLENISLRIRGGEIILLAGPSGSGKSTLLRILAGIIPSLYPGYQVSGDVMVFGVEPRDAAEKGLVAYVPQDPTSFFLGTTVEEELELAGNEAWGLLEGSEPLLSTRVSRLSDGQLYRLLMAVALGSGAKLVLLDEPTSHVDSWSITSIVSHVRRVCRERGASAIIVDHRIELLERLVDRIVWIGKPYNVEEKRLEAPQRVGSELVVAENVKRWFNGKPLLNGVSLRVLGGEAVAVTGRNGAGKTTLLRMLAGSLRPDEGNVRVELPLFLLPQSPVHVFSMSTVERELELHAKLWGFRGDVHDVAEVFGLERLSKQSPHSLSIGEARRLGLALAYIASPRVLLLDEPTLGLDPPSRRALLSCLEELVGKERCIVAATHDRVFARRMHRALLLERGVLREAS